MQFTGKLTGPDWAEVGRLAASKWDRVKPWLVIALFAIGTLAGAAVCTVSSLTSGPRPDWKAVAAIWAIVALLVLGTVYKTKRDRSLEIARLNAELPDQIGLTSEGVKMEGPDGASSFLPWKAFKGWREGRRVVLIEDSRRKSFVIVPVGRQSVTARESIRQFLASYIPAGQK